jgi:hypothetical protein
LAREGPWHGAPLHRARKTTAHGKVERSHLTDKKEFYQLLDYSDDVDLNKKIKQWEDFYNFIEHKVHLRERHPMRF